MNSGQTVFSQLMDRLPFYEFQKCIERYRRDAHHSVLFLLRPISGYGLGQLTYRQSLRDIEACLGSMRGKAPDLDRCKQLRPGSDRPQTDRPGGKPLRDSTDSQPNSI